MQQRLYTNNSVKRREPQFTNNEHEQTNVTSVRWQHQRGIGRPVINKLHLSHDTLCYTQ